MYDVFAADWFYIAMVIAGFAVLWLLLKGVERLSVDNWIGLIAGVVMTVYLFVALVLPERF